MQQKMNKYSFTTVIVLGSSLESVWDVIVDYTSWYLWWKGLKKLEIIQAKKDGERPKLKCTIEFFLYQLTFFLQQEKVILYKEIESKSSGDLAGTGTFFFQKKKDYTKLIFQWDVETTKFWMNLLAPLARPVFIYEHNVIMTWFGKGLAKYLHSELMSIKNSVDN